jgi:hypothetical protein
MRTYIRLLAPLSILATALYLAFLAGTRAESRSFPITTVDNQNTNLDPPIAPHLAAVKVQAAKLRDAHGTVSPIIP